MENKNLLVQNFPMTTVIDPDDHAAGTVSDWVSMKENQHLTFIIGTNTITNGVALAVPIRIPCEERR